MYTHTHTHTVDQSISPPGVVGQWPFKRSELSSLWQMHRYHIYDKYFINKLNSSSLYKKSFITATLYWFNYKIFIDFQRKIGNYWFNVNLNQINSWYTNYNECIQNKMENKLRMKTINYMYASNWKKDPLEVFKRTKKISTL